MSEARAPAKQAELPLAHPPAPSARLSDKKVERIRKAFNRVTNPNLQETDLGDLSRVIYAVPKLLAERAELLTVNADLLKACGKALVRLQELAYIGWASPNTIPALEAAIAKAEEMTP